MRISDTSLSVGQNTIYITVTAENGDERTYTLNVTRGGNQESSSDSENSSNQQNEPQYTKVTMNGTDFVISDDFGAYPLPDGFEETEIDYNGTKVKAVNCNIQIKLLTINKYRHNICFTLGNLILICNLWQNL